MTKILLASLVPVTLIGLTHAAELPFEGSFGTAAGCAVINGVTPIPDGNVRAAGGEKILNGDAICLVTEVGEPVTSSQSTTWTVTVSCESGHEQAEAGELEIKQPQGAAQISIVVLSGSGPKGTMKVCD